MGYNFGRKSLERARGVDKELLLTAVVALSFSEVDMSIPWRGGLRTPEQQKELFDAGNSRCDGFIKKSFHQSGNALDVVPYINGKLDYEDSERFQKFARIMLAAFTFLQSIGKVDKDKYLHWGGFWSARDDNNDGYLHHTDDRFGWDQPHWEIRLAPQRNVLKFLD